MPTVDYKGYLRGELAIMAQLASNRATHPVIAMQFLHMVLKGTGPEDNFFEASASELSCTPRGEPKARVEGDRRTTGGTQRRRQAPLRLQCGHATHHRENNILVKTSFRVLPQPMAVINPAENCEVEKQSGRSQLHHIPRLQTRLSDYTSVLDPLPRAPTHHINEGGFSVHVQVFQLLERIGENIDTGELSSAFRQPTSPTLH